MVIEVAKIEPLCGEIVDERVSPRVGQHAANLLFEHRRVLQAALHGRLEELVVGKRAQENDNRDASSESLTGNFWSGSRSG